MGIVPPKKILRKLPELIQIHHLAKSAIAFRRYYLREFPIINHADGFYGFLFHF